MRKFSKSFVVLMIVLALVAMVGCYRRPQDGEAPVISSTSPTPNPEISPAPSPTNEAVYQQQLSDFKQSVAAYLKPNISYSEQATLPKICHVAGRYSVGSMLLYKIKKLNPNCNHASEYNERLAKDIDPQTAKEMEDAVIKNGLEYVQLLKAVSAKPLANTVCGDMDFSNPVATVKETLDVIDVLALQPNVTNIKLDDGRGLYIKAVVYLLSKYRTSKDEAKKQIWADMINSALEETSIDDQEVGITEEERIQLEGKTE